mmetsp:Transcript_128636/g.359959  ORF Transcript_128636/g.359959 Transcript_128636/m.359959 type:complete len:366 (+) Transcript_128636:84-1181(+)
MPLIRLETHSESSADLDAVVPTTSLWSDLSLREVWDQHHACKPGMEVFFKDVQLARDGGFSEIGLLFNLDRFFKALGQLGFVVLNVSTVTYANYLRLISQPSDFLIDPDPASKRLLLNTVSGYFFRGDSRVSPTALLAFIELGILLYLIGICSRELCRYVHRRHSFERWHALSAILWEIIPALGSFSAMKPLSFVTPKVAIPEVTRLMRVAFMERSRRNFIDLSWWFFSRTCFAVVGLEAFVIKFVIASREHQSATSTMGSLFVAAAYLNQMLGVVDVSKFAQNRLFTFIFGGEDSFFSPYEMKVMKTWQAMLVMNIWRAAKRHKPRMAWFFAVCLSYDDSDFQRLTLTQRSVVHVGQTQHELTP